MENNHQRSNDSRQKDPHLPNPTRQEQSDPQKTELKGFIDEKEKLEPMDNEIDRANKEQSDTER